ncbi:MAG: DUF3168 domain-containing protein [Parvularculaceae bacterium]
MSVAAWNLQKAIFAHLSADAGVKVELGDPARIHDDPPPGAPFPYLTIGEARASDWSGVPGGAEHDVKLHIFSRYAGRREIKRIIAAVYDALHEAAFTIEGHRLVNIRFVFADSFRRADGETYQGVMRFRAVTEPL